MAVTKTINIKVNTGNAEADLGNLEKSFKDVDKAADKTSKSVDDVAGNGGAIAILDQLTGGLATRMKDAFEASKLFNGSLKATRGALIATGIGAFVVALGLVVAYWDDIVEFIEGANKKLQKQIDIGREREANLQTELDLLEIQKTTLENLGKSTAEIDRILKETLNTQLLQGEANLELLKSQLEIEQSKAIEFDLWENIRRAALGQKGIVVEITEAEATRLKELKASIDAQEKGIASIRLKQSTAIKEEREEYRSFRDEKFADFLKENDLAIKKLEAEQAQREKDKEDRAELQELLDEEEQQEIDREDRRIARLGETLKAERDLKAKEVAEVVAANKLKEDDEERLKNAKLQIANTTLGAIGSLAKEGSALAKGIAASQATISTYQGVTSALAAVSTIPEPFGSILKFANAAAVGVSGAINVKKILSTKPVSTSAPNISPSSGGGGASAPSFNLVEGTGANQIASGLAGQNAPLQAYVVSSDVSSSQSLDRNIIESSSL